MGIGKSAIVLIPPIDLFAQIITVMNSVRIASKTSIFSILLGSSWLVATIKQVVSQIYTADYMHPGFFHVHTEHDDFKIYVLSAVALSHSFNVQFQGCIEKWVASCGTHVVKPFRFLLEQYILSWWWFLLFNFHPYPRKWSNLTDVFQRGWSHQLVLVLYTSYHIAKLAIPARYTKTYPDCMQCHLATWHDEKLMVCWFSRDSNRDTPSRSNPFHFRGSNRNPNDQLRPPIPEDPCMVYLPTFTINLSQM